MPTMFRSPNSEPHEPATQRRARAIDAAAAVGRSHALDVRDPRVLADANNTIVHLRPAPVVAKVATTWIRDGHEVLAQELALGLHVARWGGPMPLPAAEVPAEVHRHAGLAITLWRHVEPSGHDPSPEVTARSLRRLHAALDRYPGRLPSYLEELQALAAVLTDPSRTPTLPEADRRFLRATFGSLLVELDRFAEPVRVLHGDPHEGNRIAAGGDVLWVDLEAACVGPVEWDLSAFDEEDAGLFDEANPELVELLRDLRSCRVAVLCWMQSGRASAVDEAAVWHLEHLKSRRLEAS